MSSSRQRSRVAIVIDSGAIVPHRFRAHPRTFIVPMLVHVGDRTYRDGVDLSSVDFYELQRTNAGRTSTSAPPPGAFLATFERAAETSDAIICITVSRTFSSSAASADTARMLFQTGRPDFDMRVIDSMSAVGGQGLIAWEALKVVESGVDIDSVEARVLDLRQRVRLVAYVDTLYYLWKGGRVPGIAHLAASLLRLKPVFELKLAQVTRVARPRTVTHATSRLVDLVKAQSGDSPVHAMVMHAGAAEQADRLRSILMEEVDCTELFSEEFTPVMGAHIGPGMVGIAFWS